MKRKSLKFENINFLVYFSSKGRHMTHDTGVAHRALCNCVVRIGHLYGWKECSDNFLHNNSTIKVRMGSKTHVKSLKITDKIMTRKYKKLKILILSVISHVKLGM